MFTLPTKQRRGTDDGGARWPTSKRQPAMRASTRDRPQAGGRGDRRRRASSRSSVDLERAHADRLDRASASSSRCSSACARRADRCCFAGLKAQPKEVFRLLRLDRSLDICATVDEAIEKLSDAAETVPALAHRRRRGARRSALPARRALSGRARPVQPRRPRRHAHLAPARQDLARGRRPRRLRSQQRQRHLRQRRAGQAPASSSPNDMVRFGPFAFRFESEADAPSDDPAGGAAASSSRCSRSSATSRRRASSSRSTSRGRQPGLLAGRPHRARGRRPQAAHALLASCSRSRPRSTPASCSIASCATCSTSSPRADTVIGLPARSGDGRDGAAQGARARRPAGAAYTLCRAVRRGGGAARARAGPLEPTGRAGAAAGAAQDAPRA